jgi:hypothetical protein
VVVDDAAIVVRAIRPPTHAKRDVIANGVGVSVSRAAVGFLHAGDSGGVLVFVGALHGGNLLWGGEYTHVQS